MTEHEQNEGPEKAELQAPILSFTRPNGFQRRKMPLSPMFPSEDLQSAIKLPHRKSSMHAENHAKKVEKRSRSASFRSDGQFSSHENGRRSPAFLHRSDLNTERRLRIKPETHSIETTLPAPNKEKWAWKSRRPNRYKEQPQGKTVDEIFNEAAAGSEAGRGKTDRMRVSASREQKREIDSAEALDDHFAQLQLGREEEIALQEEKELERQRELEKERLREELERRGNRLVPKKPVVRPLSKRWRKTLDETMREGRAHRGRVLARLSTGVELTMNAFSTLLPQPGQSGWLNDEIILGSMQQVVDFALEKTGHTRGETPRYHAFNSFFYKNLSQDGPEKVKRWATRAKIGGQNLLKVDYVFVPVHNASHWTLLVIMPKQKRVEYFDSYGQNPYRFLENAKRWLVSELGSEFKEDEWKFRGGISPVQHNAFDCGVFCVTTAKMIMLGLDPEKSYNADDMHLQRERIACELINGGFDDPDLLPREYGPPGIPAPDKPITESEEDEEEDEEGDEEDDEEDDEEEDEGDDEEETEGESASNEGSEQEDGEGTEASDEVFSGEDEIEPEAANDLEDDSSVAEVEG